MNAKALVASVLCGLAIALLTGLISYALRAVVNTCSHGYPLPWLTTCLGQQSQAFWVNIPNLVIDIALWSVVVSVALLMLKKRFRSKQDLVDEVLKTVHRIPSIIENLVEALFYLLLISFVVYAFFEVIQRYLEWFPEDIKRENAMNLLNAIIQVDGILLGFFGLVFVTILNELQSQKAALITEYLKRVQTIGTVDTNDIAKRAKASGTLERLLNALNISRKQVLQWMGWTTLLLIASILLAFSRMANLGNALGRSELYWPVTLLFVAVAAFLLTVSRVKTVELGSN